MSVFRSNVGGFTLPTELIYLCESGWWPSSDADLSYQDANFLIDQGIVKSVFLNPEIRRVCFVPHHSLATIEESIAEGDSFWSDEGVDNIGFSKSILIGDFGLGSDSAIILFYEKGTENPSVHFLDWYDLETPDGNVSATKWTKVADSFGEFCIKLKIPTGP